MRHLMRRAADAMERPEAELRIALAIRSGSERARLVEQLALLMPRERALVALLLGREPPPTTLDRREDAERLAALPLVLSSLPALALVVGAPEGLAFATRLAELCPPLPIAVVTSATLDATSLPSRTRDLLREGVLLPITATPPASPTARSPERSPEPAADGAPSRPSSADAATETSSETEITEAETETTERADRAAAAAWLAAHGADDELFALLDQASHALDASDDIAAEARARSAAELFLYRAFALVPTLRGRFELNGTLARDFGGRPLEIDLLARAERVALELDGFFHFQDASRYRRDRRKDWVLQRDGYVVMRWLAEDVVGDLETIIARVSDCVRWRETGEPGDHP